jgi:hypothetical protein
MEVGCTQNYLPIAHNGNKKGHSWPSLGVEEGQEEYICKGAPKARSLNPD